MQFQILLYIFFQTCSLCLNYGKHFLNADFWKTDQAFYVFEQVLLRRQELLWNACTAFAGSALTNQCDWGKSRESFLLIYLICY